MRSRGSPCPPFETVGENCHTIFNAGGVNTSWLIPPRPLLFSFRPPVASCRCGRLWANPGWLGKRGVTTLCGYFHHILNFPFFLLFPSVFWALCHPSLLPVAPLFETTKSRLWSLWLRLWGGVQCSQSPDFPSFPCRFENAK